MINLRTPVTCKDCGKSYLCSPATDYYDATNNTNGRCWDCMLKINGLTSSKEPVLPNQLQRVKRIKSERPHGTRSSNT